MEFPQEITNIWNAVVVSNENMVYNIKNAGGNNAVNIPIGGSVTFGFTGTCEDEIISPQNVNLVTGKANAEDESYCIDYKLLSDWGSGYSAQITITNNSDVPMEAWDLEFEFDREIETIWNGVIKEHSGNKYYITNAAYNSIIPAKGSVSFGFNGSKGESMDEPENYRLIHSGNVIYTDIDGKEETNDEKDTDGDKLPDWFEEIMGSSIDKEDTDSDGLTDYDELVLTNTNPIKYDTDGNGVCDADEDTDEDDLANAVEMELGTNPSNMDTDSDGLTDYDELYVYNTNPLKYDTDDDGLSDSDEVLFGLNPNIIDTDNDGTKDSDEKIKQIVEEKIQCDELKGITDVSVTIEVSGNINNSVDIKNMYNKNMLSSGLVGIQGAPMDITCSQDFDTAEIVFTYDENKLSALPENLGVLWYNEDEQLYEVMDTTLDKDNHSISVTTPHFSEYTVVDLAKWNKAWSTRISYEPEEIVQKNTTWKGIFLTSEQFMEEIKDCLNCEKVLKSYDIEGLLNQGVLYARAIDFQVVMKNGENINYSGVFVASHEFNRILNSIENGVQVPYPQGGGLSFVHMEHGSEYVGDCTTSWPEYENMATVYSWPHDIRNKFIVYDGLTDTDGDGLYDIYETNGMKIANGQVIYTDPCNKDTDGDGLLDGYEMGKYDMVKDVFVCPSDPNNIDTDGDGIIDYADAEVRVYNEPDKIYCIAWSYSQDEVKMFENYFNSWGYNLEADGKTAEWDKYGGYIMKRFEEQSMFEKAAVTKRNELIKSGISEKNIDFVRIDNQQELEEIWGNWSKYDNVGGLYFFSHGYGESADVYRGSEEFWVNNKTVLNWSKDAVAIFYGCNTANGEFAQTFANRQGVNTYAQPDYSDFSLSPYIYISVLLETNPEKVYLFDYEVRRGLFRYNEDGNGKLFVPLYRG